MAGEHELGNAVARECAHFKHLCAGPGHLAGPQPRSIADADHTRRLTLANVVHAQQPRDLHFGRYLLAALADGRVRGMLVVVDVASGQAPETVAGLDRPAADHDLPLVVLDDDQGHHFRVAPEHVPALGATFDCSILDSPRLKGGTAVHAVVTHRTDGRHLATRILATSSR